MKINKIEVIKELEERRKNLSSISTEELFAKYGEPAPLEIIGFREITKKNGEQLIGIMLKNEPEKLYFAGVELQNLYTILKNRAGSAEELNEYLRTEPFNIRIKWDKSYMGNRMVVVCE